VRCGFCFLFGGYFFLFVFLPLGSLSQLSVQPSAKQALVLAPEREWEHPAKGGGEGRELALWAA